MTNHPVSISLTDFCRLVDAARFGVEKAKGFKADYVVDAWSETVERLQNMLLDDGRTQEQRDAAFLSDFAEQCATHGCD